MSIIDRLLTILAPYECLGCTAEGDLLCATCAEQLPGAPERCYRCQVPSAAALTCAQCLAAGNLCQIFAGTEYSGIAKELVLGLKFAGAQAAARKMAMRLAPMATGMNVQAKIVPVPTAAARMRGRGFDQAKLLARELSRQTRLTYLDCLARSGNSRQLGESRRHRLSQLDGAFRVVGPPFEDRAEILLVDDVLTTGATLEAAAKALKTHGAGRISGMVFAQA